jgi:hypothetical protein
MIEVATKLLRWLIFGVIVALLPLVVSYLEFIAKKKTPSLEQIIGDGGLLLIISAACAGSFGEIIGSGPRAILAKIISSGGTIIILIMSSLLFAAILESRSTPVCDDKRENSATRRIDKALAYDDKAVASISIWIFAIGLLPCAACIALSEL